MARDSTSKSDTDIGDPRPKRAEPGKILMVDDDEMVLQSLSTWIGNEGHGFTACRTPSEAIDALAAEPHDVMITDLMLEGMDGLELMDRARAINPELHVVILTSHGSIETAILAIRGGAFDYLLKPAHKETIRHVLRRIQDRKNLRNQVNFLRAELRHSFHTGEAIGKSHQMRHLFELTNVVADSRAPVLIHGEGGTGKEVLARLLHARSSRSKGPFVSSDCKGVNETFLDDELFGSPSAPEKPGKLSRANEGTLFLKEAGRLPPALQIRLLNFFQDGTLKNPKGGVIGRPDVRMVASASEDLSELVAAGRFRKDLYYRLSVVNMEVPPLRDRKTDILPLAEHFLKRACAEHDLAIQGFHRHALSLFLEYHWPGNVTELEETVEEAALACTDRTVMFHHLPVSIRKLFTGTPLDWNRSIKEVEREHIVKVLEGVGWNRTRAASVLGIRRMTLYNKIREYKLKPLRS